MVNTILLSVKDPVDSKQRLASILSPLERKSLVWAMLKDVSSAIAKCHLVDRIVIVAHDPEIIQYAYEKQWEVLSEKKQISENKSVDWASEVLAEEGVNDVLRLPIDIPLVQAQDLDNLFKETLTSPYALLVPSRDGLGTNALRRSPPNLFPSKFGSDSFMKHMKEARRLNVTVKVKKMPRIALDIDKLSDLQLFLKKGHGTKTEEMIRKVRTLERFF